MVWLRPGWLREGPGIDKDAPPKTGLALFFEIFEREFWQILMLNLLFVVCAAPLVTFGPARAALSRCTVNMVRDIPNDVFSDFRRALKQDFRRNAAVGLAELFGIGLLLAAARKAPHSAPDCLQLHCWPRCRLAICGRCLRRLTCPSARRCVTRWGLRLPAPSTAFQRSACASCSACFASDCSR